MRNKLIIALFLFIPAVLFAQNGAVSDDNSTLVSIVFSNNANVAYVHDLNSFSLKNTFKTDLLSFDRIGLSAHGKYLYLESGKTIYIYNTASGKLIRRYYQVDDFSFSPGEHYFAALRYGNILRLNLQSGKEDIYGYSGSQKITGVKYSDDGKYLITRAQDAIYLWKASDKNMLAAYRGNDYRYLGNGKLLIIQYNKGDIRYEFWNIPASGEPQRSSVVTAYDLLKKANAQPAWFSASKSSVSPDGKYALLYTAVNGLVELYVFSVPSGKLIAKFDNNGHNQDVFYPVHWISPASFVGMASGLNAYKFDLRAGGKKKLYLAMLNPSHRPNLSLDEQRRKRIISPQFGYVAMPLQEGMRNFVLLRASGIPKRQVSYADAKFIAFSKDEKYAFLLVKDLIFLLKTSDLREAMAQNKVAKLTQLDMFRAENLSGEVEEKLIPKDANPPKGYKYFAVSGTKKVAAVDTARLHVLFRGMNLDPKNVSVKLNLVDDRGNVVLGATDAHWLYLWCNLLLQNKNMKVEQTNFVVKEVHDNQPAAIALVLDHSGSMGDRRANSLQHGAWRLIQDKRPQDAYMLIKYDNHVKLEVGLTKDKALFYRKLNNVGLTGFGGGTALVDAAYLAVLKLANAPYKKKVVMLFTDGYENSSVHNKKQLLDLAKKYNVEIYTIGFGNEINTDFLEELAYQTGGSFYHIYRTSQLKNIFKDVDLKRRYYYEIKFSTDYSGKYIALLQLCQDWKHHDSIVVKFNNNPKAPVKEKVPTTNVSKNELNTPAIEKKLVPCKKPDKPVTNKQMLTEFNNIDFPDILFAFDSDRIIKSEEKGLNEIAAFMKKYPYVYLEIDGHTDSVGNYAYNLDLSKRRAEAAKRLLVAKGIAPGRILTRGFGESRPVTTNSTEEGRHRNRRIEFHILKY